MHISLEHAGVCHVPDKPEFYRNGIYCNVRQVGG